ncbi:hypothetical protein [Tepidibacter sp. Z1-5]|uniref:hypothetical protein n=1 Tax=Tepidibacter sp. Z1-5 TaxID=3134138 RepID=UPI0030BBC139
MTNYKEILNPFPLDDKTVFGKVIRCDKIDNKDNEGYYYVVEITLTNKEMISFDEDIYSNDGLLNSITKYALEADDSFRNKIKNSFEKYNLTDDLNWVFDVVSDYKKDNKKILKELKKIYNKFTPYFYEFSAIVEDLDLGEELFNYYHENKYCEFILCDSSQNKKYNEHIIKGNLIFSASPIEVRNKCLVITDNTIPSGYLNRITDKTLFETGHSVINISHRDMLKNLIDKNIPKKIKKIKYTMFNVGQGLCSYVSLNRNYGIFFDVGFTKIKRDTKAFLNKDAFKTRIPKIIILSHWDLDHILGVSYCNKEIYNRIWIAPDINEIKTKDRSISALRLSKYLQLREALNNFGILPSSSAFKKYLFLINNSFDGQTVYKNKNIILHKGYNDERAVNGKKYSNYKNNFGLLLELKNKRNLLLTGDTDYYRMPKSIKSTMFNFLQVPHHGADAGTPKYRPLKRHPKCSKKCSVQCGLAIVSVSEDFNSHNHPKYKEHLKLLERYGYEIHRTDEDGECVINL